MKSIEIAKKFVNKNLYITDALKKVYSKIPPETRISKETFEWYNFLNASEYWDENRIKEYQLEQIKNLLIYSYNNVPYYKNTIEELGINIDKMQDFDEFKKLPFSSRHLFIENLDDLVNKNAVDHGCIKVHTSGTTGNPLVFYQDQSCLNMEQAFIYNVWRRTGYTIGDKRVLIRGDVLSDIKPYKYTGSNTLILSPSNINECRVRRYLKLIESFGSKFIHGYPSAISLIAKVILENKIEVPFKTDAVLLGSEPIYDWQRQYIEKAFACRVFSHYGNTEQVALAAECEQSTNYHFVPQYSYVELDENTNEIIGTSFINKVNPFIRHRTKDIACPTNDKCKCGRHGLYIKRVEGRQGDYLISKNGDYIFPQSVTWAFIGIESLRETQIVQNKDLSINFSYTPYDNVSKNIIENDLDNIKNGLIELMGGKVPISFELKKFIERSSSGKFRWITSNACKISIEEGVNMHEN